jgi:molybdenum cofactor guanylyltransferase
MLFHMEPTKISRSGFVLAGGKSSRMGTDKAFVEFRGQTLLVRALNVAGAVCASVTIVGDPARFGEYGKTVADTFSGCGPLAGIHAALVSSSTELNLMLAVDMPFVTQDLFAFLFGEAEKSDAMITVPRTGKGLQPLCAIYRREFSTPAEEALRAGKYKIDAAFSGVPIRVIEESELTAVGFSKKTFFNLNTPQDCLGTEGH